MDASVPPVAPNPTCPRCAKAISSDDTIECDGDRVVHVDCRLPRRISWDERVLLYQYCWNHVVGECARCARGFRQDELLAGQIGDGTDRCPQCHQDLTDAMRAHLDRCTILPVEVRRRAEDARAAARWLVKRSAQLCDQADVLMREAEVAISDARKRAT
jgi:hypothetical protein